MGFIDISNVHRSFGKIKAVDNVSLQVEKGEVFGLLGPNGAGKSTLISMIATILDQDSGKITVSGYDTKAAPKQVKTRIGLVPQEIALYPSLTAGENLAFWGKMYGLPKSKLKEKVDMALDIAGLKERQKDRIETYSGGMKRRINIAASLLHNPEILIMDEPTVGIDPQSRKHILDTVLDLNSRGMTIVYTSHYMEEVEYLCQRIAIMDNGKIIALGEKEELKLMAGSSSAVAIEASNIDEELIGRIKSLEGVEDALNESYGIKVVVKDPDAMLSRIIEETEKGDSTISSVNVEKPNLESVFLHLTGKALRD